MAAPMFSIATLFSSAAAGIDDALDMIDIPDLSDAIDLGPFDFIGDALDDIVDLLEGILRGLLYILLIVFFDQFINGIKAQFLGSFTSAAGLVRHVHTQTYKSKMCIKVWPLLIKGWRDGGDLAAIECANVLLFLI